PGTSFQGPAPNGVPLGVGTSNDPAPPYAIAPPQILDDPNAIAPWLATLGVPAQKGAPPLAPRDDGDPISRALAAYIAHIEGQDDVAGVLLQPLIADLDRSTGPALALAAVFLEKDPIYPPSDARD